MAPFEGDDKQTVDYCLWLYLQNLNQGKSLKFNTQWPRVVRPSRGGFSRPTHNFHLEAQFCHHHVFQKCPDDLDSIDHSSRAGRYFGIHTHCQQKPSLQSFNFWGTWFLSLKTNAAESAASIIQANEPIFLLQKQCKTLYATIWNETPFIGFLQAFPLVPVNTAVTQNN